MTYDFASKSTVQMQERRIRMLSVHVCEQNTEGHWEWSWNTVISDYHESAMNCWDMSAHWNRITIHYVITGPRVTSTAFFPSGLHEDKWTAALSRLKWKEKINERVIEGKKRVYEWRLRQWQGWRGTAKSPQRYLTHSGSKWAVHLSESWNITIID